MEGIVVLAFIILGSITFYKTKLSYYQKMTVKAVVLYVAVCAFGLSVLAMLGTIGGVIYASYEDTVETRMDSYSWYCSKGDFDSLSMMLSFDESYEEEFDYLWEQVDMYDTYNQYQIYRKAAENAVDEEHRVFYETRAEKCKETLQEICRESRFEENALYAEYYGTVVWE